MMSFDEWLKERVDSDPSVMGGEPVIKGSRLTIRQIAAASVEQALELLDDYPYLTGQDISHAYRYINHKDPTWVLFTIGTSG
jgi:uncharacterized protein (DUF433 family)